VERYEQRELDRALPCSAVSGSEHSVDSAVSGRVSRVSPANQGREAARFDPFKGDGQRDQQLTLGFKPGFHLLGTNWRRCCSIGTRWSLPSPVVGLAAVAQSRLSALSVSPGIGPGVGIQTLWLSLVRLLGVSELQDHEHYQCAHRAGDGVHKRQTVDRGWRRSILPL